MEISSKEDSLGKFRKVLEYLTKNNITAEPIARYLIVEFKKNQD